MALTNFLSTVWSAQLLASLQKSLVFGQAGVVNRNYEGEIATQGQSVKINSIGAITIGDYVSGTQMAVPEALNGQVATLTVDQAKFFNFLVEDIDKAQANVEIMQNAMQQAAYDLRNMADKHIAGLYTDALAGNVIGTEVAPITLSVSNVYDQLVDMATLLDENDIPETNRWVAVPAFVEGLLRKDDRFAKNETNDTARNGQIGFVSGMRVLKSNNVAKVGEVHKVMAGYEGAITFAEQIASVEGYRPERSFADALKGLHLYGAAVTRPSGLVVLNAIK